MHENSGSPQEPSRPEKRQRGGAALVAAGIFMSRIAGLVRSRVFGSYFGTSLEADAFNAALRIPNFLQNLFGEGVLSGSFIPVYARLLAQGDSKEADRVAGVIATLLAIVVSLLSLAGVLFAPHLVRVITPGFSGRGLELTISCVRIMFPSVALLVMSAWCLGVLNSHRKFLLSYTAPVLWNGAIIAVLLIFGGRQNLPDLAVTACWGLVLGSFLQFAIQLPVVFKLAKELKFHAEWKSPNVRSILSNFGTVVVGRGVVQISAYVDMMLASCLTHGAVTVMQFAQTLYLLPVSLFGMSVSAASLTEMSRSRAAGGDEAAEHARLRAHMDHGLRQVAFFIVPSVAAFVCFGDRIAALLFQTGKFSSQDVKYVWFTLAGSSIGLLAITLGRLYSSAFYALQDTRTPLRFACVRVVLTTLLGYFGGVMLLREMQWDMMLGTAALATTSSIAGWVEFYLLRRALNRRIGRTGLGASFMAKLWSVALASGGAALGVKFLLEHLGGIYSRPLISGVVVCGVFGTVYLAGTMLAGVPQARDIHKRILRRK